MLRLPLHHVGIIHDVVHLNHFQAVTDIHIKVVVDPIGLETGKARVPEVLPVQELQLVVPIGVPCLLGIHDVAEKTGIRTDRHLNQKYEVM